MAFTVEKVDDGRVCPVEYIPTDLTPVVGLAANLSSGKLVKASSTVAPEYIIVSTTTDGAGNAAAIRVDDDIVFATTFSAAATAINIGDKVTIATDALRVTATTSSGVAEVVGKEGTATGSVCYVRF